MLLCKQVCQSSLLSGRNVRWPRRLLSLVSHGEYADGTDRHTDRQTDARPLHYAFRYGRGQRNNDYMFVLVILGRKCTLAA